MAALAGYAGSITVTSTPNVALSNYNLTDAGAHITFTNPVAQAAKRYWDKSAAFAFQTSPDGVTWTTVAPASVQYVDGSVTFANPVTGGTPSARVLSGAYLPYSNVTDCKQWEIVPQVATQENTSFQSPSSRFKTYVPTLVDVNIKISKFYADNTFFTLLTTVPTPLLIVSLYTGRNANERFDCYARLKQDDIKTPVQQLIEEQLDLMADGPLYYIPS